ncbi:5246_t:CDS:2 [Entrophospora sp. SA101]|nr:10459_t:CDS:2 [Entrophospora sp. SA101]CAJ0747144.1 5246_t:CDS:2 [Entrophospora sp. SA101]
MNLIQALANIGEEGRKTREQMAREEAKEKQEQAEKKKKDQAKKEKDRKEKTEQKERERAEKLQKEQEAKEKEAEERFKNSEDKDSGFQQKKEEIDNKIADLEKKLHDQEKLGDADNPSRKKEKEDLEKQLKENIFRLFREISRDKIKVVILGQDPYHLPEVADGIAFSTQKPNYLPASLRNIFLEFSKDLNCVPPTKGNLLPWVKEGIFLVNTALTVRDGQALSHMKL